MLFTLLGVKHLLFAPLGFLSFFSLADSLWLFFFFSLPSKKGDFIKTLVAAQHLVWERSIAHDAPPKKKPEKKRGWRSLASCLRWRGTWRRSIVHLTNSRNSAAVCFLHSAITGRARYDALSGFFLFSFSFPREFTSEVWRDFTINNNSRDLEVFQGAPIFLWNIKQAQWEVLIFISPHLLQPLFRALSDLKWF